MWRSFLFDTMTGRLGREIDVPGFTWSVSVSDSTFSTRSNKGLGEGSIGGVELPWTAFGEHRSASDRASAVSCARRSIALCWDAGGELFPIVAGAIANRTDTFEGTSITLDSVMSILSKRILVSEGQFVQGGAELSLGPSSRRGLAAQAGWRATEGKPGGSLPVDWSYMDEGGSWSRVVWPYDAENAYAGDVVSGIADEDGGPDICFRPYIEGSCLRHRMVAGTDADPYLGDGSPRVIATFPGGGTLDNVSVARVAPQAMRVYATGAGSESAQLVSLAENLAMCRMDDPWPLAETALSESSVEDRGTLDSLAQSALAASAVPAMQVSGTVHMGDAGAPALGTFWPGDVFEWRVDGFPTLPDGSYRLRLLEMSGDEGFDVDLVFDAVFDPCYQ